MTPLGDFTPGHRVITAVFPFAVAMFLRLFMGRTKFVHWFITLSTMWFAFNVLLAPYSAGIRQDLLDWGAQFR